VGCSLERNGEQGRTYYWFKKTQKVQWEKPTAESDTGESKAPPVEAADGEKAEDDSPAPMEDEPEPAVE